MLGHLRRRPTQMTRILVPSTVLLTLLGLPLQAQNLKFEEHLISNDYTYGYAIAAADLDGDGDLDMSSSEPGSWIRCWSCPSSPFVRSASIVIWNSMS